MITQVWKYWREILISLLSLVIVAMIIFKPTPAVVTKVEIKEVEKVVEKEVVKSKDKTTRKTSETMVARPDGTRIITKTVEDSEIKSGSIDITKTTEKQKESLSVTTKKLSRYFLSIDANMYDIISSRNVRLDQFSVNVGARLGDLPIFLYTSTSLGNWKQIKIGLLWEF